MASWVITMSRDYPQHWEIATEHGFWDMTSRHGVSQGDHVYFWLAGGSFLGRTRATRDAYEIRPQDHRPWDDSGVRDYTWRFTFELLSEAPNAQPRWGEVSGQMSNPGITLQTPRRFDDPRDEAVLASYFPRVQIARSSFEDNVRTLLEDAGIDVPELDIGAMGSDERRFAEQLITVREGQQRFRSDLLAAYGRCAVTGTDVPGVLEAAHIAKYGGKQTNQIRNGLLLRSDIHRLFDQRLVTVTPDYIVRVSPALKGSPYADFDVRPLTGLPDAENQRPSPTLLAEHNERCPWLSR